MSAFDFVEREPPYMTDVYAQLRDASSTVYPDDQFSYMWIPGFDDLIGEPLGSNFMYNTSGASYQLMLTLALCAENTLHSTTADTDIKPEELIPRMRDMRVLSGTRLIDLGCGLVPSFAIAA